MGHPMNEITDVANLLRRHDRILFITGAGLSADSGLPTYRGIGGLYHDRNTEEDIPIEVALSGDMLLTRPEVTWKYLREIEHTCRGGKPNRGHKVIAEIEAEKSGAWVLTQNVDGFHRAAGSRNLIEIHGRISSLYCIDCDYYRAVDDYQDIDDVPRCPDCEGLIRPNVVLFGEMLPEDSLVVLIDQLQRGFDLVFSIGTSSIFPYITQPILDAHRLGIPTVEINPGTTDISHVVDYKFTTGAADTLHQLWSQARE